MAFDLTSCPSGWSELTAARGRTIVGAGQGTDLTNRILDSSFGEENHILNINEMPSHNHPGSTSTDGNHNHATYIQGVTRADNGTYSDAMYFGPAGGVDYYTYIGYAGSHSHSVSTSNNGGGTAHNNMPPSYTLLYCKKN